MRPEGISHTSLVLLESIFKLNKYNKSSMDFKAERRATDVQQDMFYSP